MNYTEIEKLKYTLANLVRQGCMIRIPNSGAEGKVVGVGFKPYWTNPIDSKIDKLEFNIMDAYGRIMPIKFNYVTGYDILSQGGGNSEKTNCISLDISVYSPNKTRNTDFNEKIRIDITSEPAKKYCQ
ncbi:MAG: hypothetical protein N3I35_15610 [Clostridia bacterium]|nr:hypothetical protein [Clostridia bacterium]